MSTAFGPISGRRIAAMVMTVSLLVSLFAVTLLNVRGAVPAALAAPEDAKPADIKPVLNGQQLQLTELGPGLYDDTDTRIGYVGRWNHGEVYPAAYNSTMHFSKDKTAKVTFRFQGTGFLLYRVTYKNRGLVNVVVDGTVQYKNNYAEAAAWRVPLVVSNLANGSHTVEIQNTAEFFIDVDAIQIFNGTPNILLPTVLYGGDSETSGGSVGLATVPPAVTNKPPKAGETNTPTATGTATPAITSGTIYELVYDAGTIIKGQSSLYSIKQDGTPAGGSFIIVQPGGTGETHPVWNPGGSKIAYLDQFDAVQFIDVGTKTFQTPNGPGTTYAYPQSKSKIAFDPTGNPRFVYVDATSGDIVLWDNSSGPVVTRDTVLVSGGATISSGVTWNGTTIGFVDSAGNLKSIQSNCTAPCTPVDLLNTTTAGADPEFSSDGSMIAFVSGTTLNVYQLSTQIVYPVVNGGPNALHAPSWLGDNSALFYTETVSGNPNNLNYVRLTISKPAPRIVTGSSPVLVLSANGIANVSVNPLAPAAIPTNTPAPTATFTSSPTDTYTPGGPTITPTDTNTPTATFTPTDTYTPGGPTITSTFTDTPSVTPSVTPTDTYTPGGPTITPTDTNTPTATFTPTDTYTPGGPTITSTFTNTPSLTPSLTPTDTYTPGGPTITSTFTFTPSVTPSVTPTDTYTPGGPTVTSTFTYTPSPTATNTPICSFPATNTSTPTPSQTPIASFTPGTPTLVVVTVTPSPLPTCVPTNTPTNTTTPATATLTATNTTTPATNTPTVTITNIPPTATNTVVVPTITNTPGGATSTSTITPTVAPQPTFGLTVNNTTPRIGDILTFTLTINNPANGTTLTGIYTAVTVNGRATTPSGATPSTNTLPPGQIGSYLYNYTVDGTEPCNLAPMGSVNYTQNTSPQPIAVAYTGTPITLQVLKTPTVTTNAFTPGAGTAVALGQQVITQTTVINNGCLPATFSAVSNKAGDPISWQMQSGGATTQVIGPNSSAIFYSTHTVLATDTNPLTLQYTVSGSGPGTGAPTTAQVFTASATGAALTYQMSGVPTTGTPGSGTLSITKTSSVQNASAGQSFAFTITVNNATTFAFTNIAITDNVPSDTMTVTGVSASGGAAATNSGNSVTVALASLAPSQSITVTVNVKVNAGVKSPTQLTNSATLNYTGGTPLTASVTVPIGTGASVLPTTGFGGPDPESQTLVLIALGALALAAFSFAYLVLTRPTSR